MDFSKELWKDKASKRLNRLKELIKKAGTPVYATVAGMTLMPLVEVALSAGISSISPPLMNIISNLGTNLVSTELEKWKDSNKKISEVN